MRPLRWEDESVTIPISALCWFCAVDGHPFNALRSRHIYSVTASYNGTSCRSIFDQQGWAFTQSQCPPPPLCVVIHPFRTLILIIYKSDVRYMYINRLLVHVLLQPKGRLLRVADRCWIRLLNRLGSSLSPSIPYLVINNKPWQG